MSETDITVWRSSLVTAIIKKVFEVCEKPETHIHKPLDNVNKWNVLINKYSLGRLTPISFSKKGWFFKRYFVNVEYVEFELTKCEFNRLLAIYESKKRQKEREISVKNKEKLMEFAGWQGPFKQHSENADTVFTSTTESITVVKDSPEYKNIFGSKPIKKKRKHGKRKRQS